MTGQSDRIPPTDRRYPQRVYQCLGCWSLGWHRDPEDGDIECDCGERMTRIDLRGAAAPPEPPLDVERWQRLVRGLEAIRDTSTDSASRQLADSMLAMLDGGAAPDRLPSDPREPESGG